jgi:hypothetical protein
LTANLMAIWWYAELTENLRIIMTNVETSI